MAEERGLAGAMDVAVRPVRQVLDWAAVRTDLPPIINLVVHSVALLRASGRGKGFERRRALLRFARDARGMLECAVAAVGCGAGKWWAEWRDVSRLLGRSVR